MSDDATEPLANRVAAILKDLHSDPAALAAMLRDEDVGDIAAVMDQLESGQCEQVLRALDKERAAELLTQLEPELTRELVCSLDPPQFEHVLRELSPREAARVAAEAPSAYLEAAKAKEPTIATDAKSRAEYPEGSAGRLMTNQFIRLRPDMRVAEALEALRRTDPEVDTPDNLYVVRPAVASGQAPEHLEGAVSIRSLVMADPAQTVREVMAKEVITVEAGAKEDAAANLFSQYKFSTLPVVDKDGLLVGVIPAEDLMRVVVSRLRRRYARMVGTDAEAMEKATPLQEAKLRVPWLLGTMVLEMGAGLVIARFNQVLEKIILLASFMPVISAVAGNVGLQAAAITVRALDTGQTSLKNSGKALLKEATVTLLMGAACALVLGTIGLIWSKKLMFAIVIAIALGCSMLTACLMGTIIPMVSKRLGFDPATTAGPFETAFQDIIGFGVFLGLATLLLQ
jgi:magnesium transporter